MVLMEWRSEYSVGISKIDDQHKKLIELLNVLHKAMYEGKGKEVLSTLLTELVDYTLYHFNAEESVLMEHHYSKMDDHFIKHQALKMKVEQYHSEVMSGKRMVSVEILNFLQDWINVHILQEDSQYGKELAGKVV